MRDRMLIAERFAHGLLLAALIAGVAVSASPAVHVLGLFKDRAVLVIDGRQRLLLAGQTSPEGVTLVSADSEQAVLAIDGVQSVRKLGARISADYAPATAPRAVQLLPDAGNMYTASGSINGFAVQFVLDTGASAVVLSGTQARRLGIDFEREGTTGMADTPTGPTPTYGIVLDRVRLGEIELRGVRALVIAGEFPGETLLGMSFIGRLELNQRGRVMELRMPQ